MAGGDLTPPPPDAFRTHLSAAASVYTSDNCQQAIRTSRHAFYTPNCHRHYPGYPNRSSPTPKLPNTTHSHKAPPSSLPYLRAGGRKKAREFTEEKCKKNARKETILPKPYPTAD